MQRMPDAIIPSGRRANHMDVLERFAATLGPEESQVRDDLKAFLEWYAAGREFVPAGGDDVALRTYLMQLQTDGAAPKDRRARMASIRRFYDWAEREGLLDYHPFASFSIERPSLKREQIRRREEVFKGSAEDREIARLRLMNRLAEQLNGSPDAHTALTAALESLVTLMGLQTGWAFQLPAAAEGGFGLAAACGLPPGLEKNDRHHLSKPEECHCQSVMLAGRLRRAVNIVECTRLQDAARDDGDNQGLLFHASVPIMAAGRPLGIINVATQEWQFLTAADLQLLSAVGAQVGIALERARLYDLTRAQQLRLERELGLARAVQESLLPQHLPPIHGYSLAADWHSALEMAGDFYDIFPLPDGRWGLLIADVSDKGAAAAMYMAMTRSLIRASAVNYAGPAGTLKEVNRDLIAHSSADMFVTVFYAVLEPGSHRLTYANAGQNPPLLRRPGGELEQLGRTGMALGLFEGIEISEASLTLAAGSTLVLYTDGLTDALNTLGQEYSFERLMGVVKRASGLDAGSELADLLDDLKAFTGDVPPFDDVTLFVLARER